MGESPFTTGTTPAQHTPSGRQGEGTAAQAVPGVVLPEEEVRDARIQVTQDATHMTAVITIDAPSGGGEEPTEDSIRAALQKAGITYGIDEEAVARLAGPLYGKEVVVARGLAPVDGEDGKVNELFSRIKEQKFAERENGTVDFRELSLITDVKPGTVICEITPPTAGTAGCNVMGTVLKAREGKKVMVPAGEGTQLSEDGLRLEAAVSGNLEFRGGRFVVDRVYRVENIDYEVGNITFSGDVLVNGEMMDGFEIHAGGNVTLRGRVGSVVIEAQNITIDQGINGTGKAVISAADTIKAGFIENCNVSAGVKIIADSIINSKVECEGDVEVTGKKGLICGGKITAFGSVKANAVGNEFNTLTVITLGVTPKLLKERKRLADQLVDVEKHIDGLSKNVAYIERLVAEGRPVPPDRVQLLQRTQIQLPMSEKKRDQLNAAIADMDEKMAGVNNATLTARIIYPPTKISIGALSTNCIETRQSCRVYRDSRGELVFGSY